MIGGVLAKRSYDKGNALMRRAERRASAAEAEARALTPAEAKAADAAGVVESDRRRRKGVQSTFLASMSGAERDVGVGS